MSPEQKLTTLGEIADQRPHAFVDGPFGSNLPASSYSSTGVPLVRGSNLGLGNVRFREDEFVYVPEEVADRLKRSACEPLDIIFTKKGTIGQTGIIPVESKYKRYLLSGNQLKLTVDRKKADPMFVYYSVSSPASRSKIIRDSTVTGVPKTNLAYLKTFPIWLPPLAEQKAIAAILGALDDKIELNRRMNATLEAMARSLFQSWFVDFDPVRAKLDRRQPTGLDSATAGLFPNQFEDSELGAIPKGWTIEPIGDVIPCVGGSTPSTAEAKFWQGGTHCWATPKDLSALEAPVLIDTERKITDAAIAKISSGLLPVGTLLLSSRAPVGYLAIATMPVAINQGFIAMKCNKRASNYFMLNWCRSSMTEIENRASGTTFAEISKQNFRPIPLVIPSKWLMEKFTSAVTPLYTQIVLNVHESRTLVSLRNALLPKLLNGDVRLRLQGAVSAELASA